MRGMLMLAPAHVGHLAMLRTLIREAAAEGSFDRGLAADTPAAVEFFARLKRALVSGYFVEEDPRTGRVESVAVPGYVFWPDDRNSSMAPVGFGLFRALEGGHELWLAGLEFGRRGGGYGRESSTRFSPRRRERKPGSCAFPAGPVMRRWCSTSCSRTVSTTLAI